MKTTIRNSGVAGATRYGCALVVCTLPCAAFGDWEATPDVRMEVEANDNPRLGQQLDADTIDDRTATRALMDARMRLRNSGPRGEFSVQPRVRVDAYADAEDDDLERQDVYLNANGNYSWRRATAGIAANFARESIISSELSDSQPITDLPIDDPIQNDTGLLVFLDEFRNRFVLAPNAEFTLSERSAILLEARRLDVSYTGPEFRGRSDFNDTSLSVGVGRTIDDRTGATARMIVSRYQADVTSNETDTVGVEGSFTRELNELWSFSLTTGLQRSDFTYVDATGEFVDNAATNYTMSIEFGKRTELSAIDIGLFRMLNPNAVGYLVERNELRVHLTRQLSERLRVGFGFRAMETGALDRDLDNRELVRADFDIEWAFTPSWSFAARYGAIDQDFGGDRIDGTANMLSVGAVYRGLARPGRVN